MTTDDGLVRLAQALIETKHLRDWFDELKYLPADCRTASLLRMAAEMREDGEDPHLAEAIASLADAQIYKSVVQTVQERVAERGRDQLQ